MPPSQGGRRTRGALGAPLSLSLRSSRSPAEPPPGPSSRLPALDSKAFAGTCNAVDPPGRVRAFYRGGGALRPPSRSRSPSRAPCPSPPPPASGRPSRGAGTRTFPPGGRTASPSPPPAAATTGRGGGGARARRPRVSAPPRGGARGPGRGGPGPPGGTHSAQDEHHRILGGLAPRHARCPVPATPQSDFCAWMFTISPRDLRFGGLDFNWRVKNRGRGGARSGGKPGAQARTSPEAPLKPWFPPPHPRRRAALAPAVHPPGNTPRAAPG